MTVFENVLPYTLLGTVTERFAELNVNSLIGTMGSWNEWAVLRTFHRLRI